MGFGDMKEMFSKVREAQKHIKSFQKELSSMRIAAETGGGTVKAVVDGEAMLVDIEIDESVLDADEIKILPGLIKKAVIEAQKKAKEEAAEKAKSLTGGIDIPGLGL
ncbi:MAG: YbaB/EbfC family nucleoid-associated protein [Spirochaetia bacterium]|nr:YbaB/EbfC family nucleoid-associated protein [Spirochaetia bacterium]